MAGRRALGIALAAALLSACWMRCGGAAPARTKTEISGKGSLVGETALGDLVADAVRAAAKAEIGLVPAVWLREVTLPPGEIAADAPRSLFAFPDEKIAVLSLDGARLAAALERGVALVPRPNKGFLQVSGLAVKFDRRAPPESRVKEILVAKPRLDLPETPAEGVLVVKQRLDPDKVYKVAMPLGLAKGALGYFRVFNGARLTTTDLTLAEALTRFLAAHDVVSLKVGERLRDLGAPPEKKP